ncbi:MFS transporter, partial [Pseudomonas sp. MDMC216]
MHDPHSERMSSSETRAAGGLAMVFAFRMLGMFMVLPVLATYGMDLAGSTPALIGLAIGAYGLTQAVLQIPFGMLSDRIGRRYCCCSAARSVWSMAVSGKFSCCWCCM